MDAQAVYDRLDDYEKIASSRGVLDAEGVAGDVAARLWRNIDSGADVTPALERIVLSGAIIDALRAQHRCSPTSANETLAGEKNERVSAPARPTGLSEVLLAASLRHALVDAVPRRQALAWAMINLNGLSPKEAAAELGVTRQAVEKAAESCRLQLKRRVIV